jgi:hypothetical protein
MTNYDSSNPKHIKIAQQSAKAADEARRGFVAHIMERVDGRAYLYDLLVTCHVFAQPFSPDAHVTAFGCGELNVGQRLLADIMAYCPDHYVTMMREANARSTTDDVRRSWSEQDPGRNDRRPVYRHPALDTPGEASGNNSPPAGNAGEGSDDYNPVDSLKE